MFLRCSFRLDSENDWMDCEIEEKNIGHIKWRKLQNDVSDFFVLGFQHTIFFCSLRIALGLCQCVSEAPCRNTPHWMKTGGSVCGGFVTKD